MGKHQESTEADHQGIALFGVCIECGWRGVLSYWVGTWPGLCSTNTYNTESLNPLGQAWENTFPPSLRVAKMKLLKKTVH